MPTPQDTGSTRNQRPARAPKHAKHAAPTSHAAPARRRSSSRPAGSSPSSTGSHRRTGSAPHARVQASPERRVNHYAVASHSTPRRRRGTPVGLIIAIVLAVVLVGVGGFFVVRHFLNPYEGTRVEDGQMVTVEIPDGSSGTQIVQILLDAGVIHSSKDFRHAVQEQNADQSLRCGTYTFETGSDPAEVVRQLVAGPNSSEGQLQIPEGLTVKQTAEVVEETYGIPVDDFLEQAKASNYVDDYAFLKEAASDSLEGFLYPKTYNLAGKEVTADAVIRLMLSQYETELGNIDTESARKKLAERYNSLNVPDYDLLKIASIIEKESIAEEDRDKVSSVFYNRLNTGMNLQSDATMGYVTGGAVTTEDLQADSPYNTYLYGGLPPTPICSPSMWALEAAMNPADTNYLFFFIIEDGNYSNHTFTETYEEHSAAYAAALEEQAAANAGGTGEEGEAAEGDAGADADAGDNAETAEAPEDAAPVDEGE